MITTKKPTKKTILVGIIISFLLLVVTTIGVGYDECISDIFAETFSKEYHYFGFGEYCEQRSNLSFIPGYGQGFPFTAIKWDGGDSAPAPLLVLSGIVLNWIIYFVPIFFILYLYQLVKSQKKQ
ncbi:MAG: hypothetical protein Q7S53_00885 [bacterium]|nr:hypothetical protein [bacterium]